MTRVGTARVRSVAVLVEFRSWSAFVFAGVLIAVVGLSACERGEGGEEAPAVSKPRGNDSPGDRLRIEDLTLAPGDSVGVAFHPTEDPARVLVESDGRESLRLCAGTGGGELVSDPAQSSWGGQWQGDLCRRVDDKRRLSLPAYSEHVSFVLLNAGDESLDVERVTLRYHAHDHYNSVRLPALAPGATSAWVLQPTIAARDRQTTTVGVQASWQPMAPGVLEMRTGRPREIVAEASGNGSITTLEIDVTQFPGREVRDVAARIRNTGTEPIQPDLWY